MVMAFLLKRIKLKYPLVLGIFLIINAFTRESWPMVAACMKIKSLDVTRTMGPWFPLPLLVSSPSFLCQLQLLKCSHHSFFLLSFSPIEHYKVLRPAWAHPKHCSTRNWTKWIKKNWPDWEHKIDTWDRKHYIRTYLWMRGSNREFLIYWGP